MHDTYRVWIQIRREHPLNMEEETHENVTQPDVLATFDTEIAARAFMADTIDEANGRMAHILRGKAMHAVLESAGYESGQATSGLRRFTVSRRALDLVRAALKW